MIYFDTRWEGAHGIGRMTTEIKNRLFEDEFFLTPKWPASPVNPLDPLARAVDLMRSPRATIYSPGFNPPAFAQSRAVFTVCDLIHLRVADETGVAKRIYYERLVRPAMAKAFRVLTISEYSRGDLLDWAGVDPSQVVNVGCGVDEKFFRKATARQPGYPYFLFVGARKPHKNLGRLLTAYAASQAKKDVKLVISGHLEPGIARLIKALQLQDQVKFAGRIPDADLPSWYQGAVALLFPSYFEGFGLPPVEAMAGGTPVLTSNATSLPEAVGDAALMVDPHSTESITAGIDRLTFDIELRRQLSEIGPEQARRHSWDRVIEKIRPVIEDLQRSAQ